LLQNWNIGVRVFPELLRVKRREAIEGAEYVANSAVALKHAKTKQQLFAPIFRFAG
jgi:hypothetical protein